MQVNTKAGSPSSRWEIEFLKLSSHFLGNGWAIISIEQFLGRCRLWIAAHLSPLVVPADHPFSRQGCFHTLLTHPAVCFLPPEMIFKFNKLWGRSIRWSKSVPVGYSTQALLCQVLSLHWLGCGEVWDSWKMAQGIWGYTSEKCKAITIYKW